MPVGDAKLSSARSTDSKYLKSGAVTAVRLNRIPSNFPEGIARKKTLRLRCSG